jgi:Flp pilus assembly secretin CpaC
MKRVLITIAVVGLLTGCASLYKSIITITEVRNTVMNELGVQYRAGRITPEIDVKIAAADKAYRAAATEAQVVLEAYKATKIGDATQSLIAVKKAVMTLVDILALYTDATVQYKNLTKATKL